MERNVFKRKVVSRIAFLLMLISLPTSSVNTLPVKGDREIWLYDTVYIEPRTIEVPFKEHFVISVLFARGFEVPEPVIEFTMGWNTSFLRLVEWQSYLTGPQLPRPSIEVEDDRIKVTMSNPMMDTFILGAKFQAIALGNTVIDLFDSNINAVDGYVHIIDASPPVISKPVQWPPPNEVEPNIEVFIDANVSDAESGVNRTILSYTTNGLTWNNITMELACYIPCTQKLYVASIPGMPANTLVQYKIIAYDNAGNYAVEDNAGQYYTYTVIPEFPSITILLILLTSLSIGATILKITRKYLKQDV